MLFDSLSTSLISVQHTPTWWVFEDSLLPAWNYPLRWLRVAASFRMLVPLALTARLGAVAANLPPSAFDACIARRYPPRACRARGFARGPVALGAG